MKSGLVLEGGAMRGLFTAGVIDKMMEENITFDGMIGVSAGAAFGCNFKSRQIGRVLRYNLRFCKDRRYCSLYSLLTTGDLFGADFCYRELPDELDIFDNDAFNENPLEFYLVATDVHTGEAVYHKCEKAGGETLLWMRASASMPVVSNVVKIGKRELLDGGIADPIPLPYFETLGYRKNVVVLTQPDSYHKEKSKASFLMKLLLKKYPALADAMANRHEIYNSSVDYVRQKEAAGEIFVIRPQSKLPIGRMTHDPKLLQAAYDLGYSEASGQLSALKDFLQK